MSLRRALAALVGGVLASCALAPKPAALHSDPEFTLAWASYFVPQELHAVLGLTEQGLAVSPPAPRDDAERIRAMAPQDLAGAERCLPVFHDPSGFAWPSSAWAAFTVRADGLPRDVVVRFDGKPRPDAERCAAAAVARWLLPAPREGGRVWLELHGRGERVVLPSLEDGPVATKPAPKVANCVQALTRIPASWAGYELPEPALVKFMVTSSGTVSRFRVASPPDLPLPIAAAVRSGVTGCAWVPGTHPNGQPIDVWVILPLSFRAGN